MTLLRTCAGKSVSEALILETSNPQYDKRLFIEFPEKYKFITCCVKFGYCFECQNNNKNIHTTCSELVFFEEFNEQSLIILWVNWCKNEGFWKRFTCKKRGVKFCCKVLILWEGHKIWKKTTWEIYNISTDQKWTRTIFSYLLNEPSKIDLQRHKEKILKCFFKWVCFLNIYQPWCEDVKVCILRRSQKLCNRSLCFDGRKI